MIFRCIDLECSGELPDADIVEVGWVDVIGEPYSGWIIHPYVSHLVNPGKPIDPRSSGIHHIVGTDVIKAPPAEHVLREAFTVPLESSIFVAHFADYEQQVLGGKRGFQWIDTWKLSIHLAPNAPNFKLQTLRYWLDLDVDPSQASPAHRSGPDAHVNAHLLVRMLAKLTPDEMVSISDGPVLLPKLFFGKYAKLPIAEVETSYLEWMLRQRNEETGELAFDKNVIHTCITQIEQRRKNWKGKL